MYLGTSMLSGVTWPKEVQKFQKVSKTRQTKSILWCQHTSTIFWAALESKRRKELEEQKTMENWNKKRAVPSGPDTWLQKVMMRNALRQNRNSKQFWPAHRLCILQTKQFLKNPWSLKNGAWILISSIPYLIIFHIKVIMCSTFIFFWTKKKRNEWRSRSSRNS